jgi:hypothetical protein
MSASELPTARRTRARTAGTTAGTQNETSATEPRVTDARPGRSATRGRAGGPVRPDGGRASADGPLVLDRYRLAKPLGAGAFGTVWAARDERLERDVAVKILPRERVVGGRFEREARAAARLVHPAIVTLYEAAVDDEGAYLVSELVRGPTLDNLLDEGRLSDRDIVKIAISLCDGLEHAHDEGVIHRDVKPSNVLVPRRPSGGQYAKLTDFGVARVIGGDSLTRTGDVVGTAAYMAPEQAEGLAAGAPADLYALALITYEALTGVNPVRTGTAASRARRLGTHLPPLRRQRRDLPRELGVGIDLALRPRPRERGTVADLRGALAASLDQLGDTPGVVTAGRFTRSGRAAKAPPPEIEFAPAAHDGATEGQPALEPGRFGFASEPATWGWRGAGALAAGAGAAWLCAHLLQPGSIPPAVGGIVTAILVLLLPRIGWLTAGLALVVTAAMQSRPGGALMLLVIAVSPALLLPLRGVAWPLPAGAVALGLIGLAGAWPAVAGRAGRTIWRRAALGALGWVWLVCAAPLAGRDLYAHRPPGTPPPDVWTTALPVAWHDVLVPILTSGVLLPAVVWAGAAVILPWLLKPRAAAIRIVLVTIWSATLVAATESALAAAHHGSAAPHGAVTGAVVAALVALVPTSREVWRGLIHPASPGAQLP